LEKTTKSKNRKYVLVGFFGGITIILFMLGWVI
jgi:hypothetical protein